MDTPRTQMTNDTETSVPAMKEQAKLNMSSIILLEHLGKVFDHLKKALVGHVKYLLQNKIFFVTCFLHILIKLFNRKDEYNDHMH